MENLGSTTPPQVKAPRGMFPGKVDEKGRLKLATALQEYLSGFGDKTLFVTSLDRHIAQIYPDSVWQENEKLLATFTGDQGAAKKVAFNAADLGADVEMDSQGRVLLHTELRRELGIENSNVRLFVYRGHVEILSDAIYQQRKQEASQEASGAVETMNNAGLR